MKYENGVEQFREETLMVESILEFHPEFHPATDVNLTQREQNDFVRFYLPDWDKFSDYRDAYTELISNDIGLESRAKEALEAWKTAHGLR